MATLDIEIATFDNLRPNLEAEHMGEWVLIREHALIGTSSPSSPWRPFPPGLKPLI